MSLSERGDSGETKIKLPKITHLERDRTRIWTELVLIPEIRLLTTLLTVSLATQQGKKHRFLF